MADHPPPYSTDAGVAPPGYPPQQGYPPPQQGYPPPQPGQTVTVVTQQPIVTTVRFGETPVTYTDTDGTQVTTRIEYKSGVLTWVIFAVICFLTGCICFAVIPFCVDATKDVYHINPKNGTVVGVYKRI